MMLTVKELNKWASLTGERARSEAKVFKSAITYMDDEGRIVTEFHDGRIEVNKEAGKVIEGRD